MKIEFGFFFLIFNIFIMKIIKSVNHEHGGEPLSIQFKNGEHGKTGKRCLFSRDTVYITNKRIYKSKHNKYGKEKTEKIRRRIFKYQR